ncbi:MAG: nucleotide exchange factor GrpE [Clostridiales bacterium]|nr:nucleotide exchange factor GrpE [Clostridiales bacterium]
MDNENKEMNQQQELESAEEKQEKMVEEECLETVEEAESVEVYSKEEYEKLETQVKELQDKYLRTFAEFDNFRKRTIKEKAGMFDDGVRETVEKIIPVLDNFERAVEAQKDKDEVQDAFYKGVNMILKQFTETMSALGVEPIKAVGEKFDPNLHAAVAHEDNEEYGENEVILEMQKGYQYKGKVIRPSMVKVAN